MGLASALPGTSSECRVGPWPRRSVGLVVEMGKRVSGPPELRSRLWVRGDGAGELARERLAMARLRSSMCALRLLSSVLMARGRPAPETECVSELARFSSPNMASLCANRSRISR
jgi:hypothetical protein